MQSPARPRSAPAGSLALARPEYTSLYIDLEIADATDRLPISEILIGPSQRQQMTTRAFRTLLYKHGYERADVVPSQTLRLATDSWRIASKFQKGK